MLRIYPKKGKFFDLEFHHFEIVGDEFILHSSTNSAATGYLTVKDIAAIVPSSIRNMSERDDLRLFTVYLKRHLENPLRIIANAYKKDSSLITFQYRQYELKEIYIATEDVLGITFVSAEA
jgi:hypothetical protein